MKTTSNETASMVWNHTFHLGRDMPITPVAASAVPGWKSIVGPSLPGPHPQGGGLARTASISGNAGNLS